MVLSKLEGVLGREKDGEIGDGDLGVWDMVELFVVCWNVGI